MHGQASAALALLDTAAAMARRSNSPFFEYAVLRVAYLSAWSAGAPERLQPILERITEPTNLSAAPRFQHLALAGLAMGRLIAADDAGARRYLARADSLAEAEDFVPVGVAEQARAAIALEGGRPEESLRYLQRGRELGYGVLYRPARLLLGDTYAALGRLEEAAAQYDSLTSTYRLNFNDIGTYRPILPVAHERLGNVYLALGDTTAAIRHLTAFAELWQDADPDLQPRVESARRTLERLVGEAR
jgi:tetratricopeptide (TPR) repeat protein